MKKPNIPEQIGLSLKNLGYHIHKKKNGDIVFRHGAGLKLYVKFLNEENTSFAIISKIGQLSNDNAYKVGLSCCIDINPTLILAKLIVEKDNDSIVSLSAIITYTCYTDSEADRFIKVAPEYLFFAVTSACNYMSKHISTYNTIVTDEKQ